MALSNNPVFVQTPKLALVQFLQGTDVAGTYKTLYTGGASGSKVASLFANSNDGSAAHLVTLQIVRGGVSYGGISVNVPISSGFASGVLPVAILTAWPGLPVDSEGNPYIFLESGDILKATFATALTSSCVLNVQGVVGDF